MVHPVQNVPLDNIGQAMTTMSLNAASALLVSTSLKTARHTVWAARLENLLIAQLCPHANPAPWAGLYLRSEPLTSPNANPAK
jgi:hypothetical protein